MKKVSDEDLEGGEYVEVLVPVDSEEGQAALARQKLETELEEVEKQRRINDLELKAGCAGLFGGIYARNLEDRFPNPDEGDANKVKKKAAAAEELGCLLVLYAIFKGNILDFKRTMLTRKIKGERTALVTEEEFTSFTRTTRELIAEFSSDEAPDIKGRMSNAVEAVGRRRGEQEGLQEAEIQTTIAKLRKKVNITLAAGTGLAITLLLIILSSLSSCTNYDEFENSDETVEYDDDPNK